VTQQTIVSSGRPTAAADRRFETRDLTPRIGSEIIADRAALLGGAYRAEIRELLGQRGVLIFRDVGVSDEEQLAFARTLGEVIPQGDKGVLKITLDDAAKARAYDYLYATICWHFDGSPDDIPSRASILSPRKLSETGGNTEFANTYASWEDLSDDDKRSIDKLRVVHRQETLQRIAHPNATEAQVALWRGMGEKAHPLVWTHQSGRKSLVLGLTATSVVGMDEAEGRALIDRLQAWATRPEYVYIHEWRMGDLLIWDNTGVIHRVQPYPPDSGRLLHRCTLVGEEPLA
jgi:alpha-ketoglutarate-dependent taurine dioxygenase